MAVVKSNSSIELLRICAVILIIFTHTRHNLTSDSIFYFIIEKLPTYGTAILSIISGYLYYTVSRKKENIFHKKIKSLAIPYLIANCSVLILVLITNFIFDYNALNRLEYNYTLITEGILTLNEPPINPPTYFIRDIFVLFCILSLFTQREFRTLYILIPLLIFGVLVLRIDVVILFVTGILYARLKESIKKEIWVILLGIVTIFVGVMFPDYLKFPVSLLLFVLLIDLRFNFYNTGRYSYLLHLYHSPIIVISYPIISLFIQDTILNVIAQILLALTVVFLLYLLTKKYKFLHVLSGGR